MSVQTQTNNKLDVAYQAALLLPMGSIERKRMFHALNALDTHLDKLRELALEKGLDFTEAEDL